MKTPQIIIFQALRMCSCAVLNAQEAMQSACWKGNRYLDLLERAKQDAKAAEAHAYEARKLIESLEDEQCFGEEIYSNYEAHIDSYGTQRFIKAPRVETLAKFFSK